MVLGTEFSFRADLLITAAMTTVPGSDAAAAKKGWWPAPRTQVAVSSEGRLFPSGSEGLVH